MIEFWYSRMKDMFYWRIKVVDTKEQFVLSLKGWKYKGVLDKWFYGISDPLGPSPYHGFRDKDGEGVGTYIPGAHIIKEEHNNQGRTMIFLADHTYYELGVRDTTR